MSTKRAVTSKASTSLALTRDGQFVLAKSTMDHGEVRAAKLPGKDITQTYWVRTDASHSGTERQPVEIRLFVDMNVGIGGDVWPAADCFCKWITLDAYHAFFSSVFNGKRVLELGSGNALVSILVDKAFATKEVVATDLYSHVAHIQHNIERNHCLRCKSASLDWVSDQDKTDSEPYDVILALECLYREELYEPLIKTLLRFSHPHSIIFLGVTRLYVKPKFFTLLAQHGFQFRKVPSELLSKHMPYETCTGMFIAQRVSFAAP